METITSVNNEKVKRVNKIMSSAKERRYSGKYLVEGLRMVREVPSKDLDQLFMTQAFFDKHVDSLLSLIGIGSVIYFPLIIFYFLTLLIVTNGMKYFIWTTFIPL